MRVASGHQLQVDVQLGGVAVTLENTTRCKSTETEIYNLEVIVGLDNLCRWWPSDVLADLWQYNVAPLLLLELVLG